MESRGYLIIGVAATGIAVAGNKFFNFSPRIGFALFTVALVAFAASVYQFVKGK